VTIFAALVLLGYLPAHYCYDLLHDRRSSNRSSRDERSAGHGHDREGRAA
jgi:hypothetical protein